MKKFIIALIVIIIAGVGIYFYSKSTSNNSTKTPVTTETPVTGTQETASTTPVQSTGPETVVGKTVEGRDITAYNFGTGDTQLLFVGGIHGGYEWNTSLVAYQMIDY